MFLNHTLNNAHIFCSVDLYNRAAQLQRVKRQISFSHNYSALSIPAPDRSIVAHGYQNVAVAAEAGLADGRRAFGEGQRGAPGEQNTRL